MKTFELIPTTNPDLYRVCDLQGDWRYYYHKPTGKYLRAVNDILNAGYPKGKGLEMFFKNNSAEEIERRLKAGGDRGDAVHQAINKMLKESGGNFDFDIDVVLAEDNKAVRRLTLEEWQCLLSWSHFWNVHECKLVDAELTVGDVTLGVAGTIDCLHTLGKLCGIKECGCKEELLGAIILNDWKTAKGLWPTYVAQVAAYYVMLGQLEKRPTFTALTRLNTNHVKTKGYEFQWFTHDETIRTFDTKFLSAMKLSTDDHRPFDPAKDVVEIPTLIHINL